MSIERIEVNGHELTAFDLPPEPSEAYAVSVDGLGEIVVEKGKPPKEKDVPAMYMRKLVPELCEQNAELYRENAKLRELVRDMMGFFEDGDWCVKCERALDCQAQEQYEDDCLMRFVFRDRMRELGIEVTE
jgi:hypothetical protein